MKPPDPLHVLYVDDDEDDFALTADLLLDAHAAKVQLEWVPRYEAAVRRIESMTDGVAGEDGAGRIDACLVDYRLGAQNGVDLIREARAMGCDLPMILLTGQADHEVDLEAMAAGASDFLRKESLSPDELERAIRYAVQRHRGERERNELLLVAQARADQLRELAKQLTQAETRERRKVAQTLHDHLQQLLVAARMRMSSVVAKVEDEAVRATLAKVDELIDQSIASSRTLSLQLSPPVLKDRGLIPALQWLGRTFEGEHDLPTWVEGDEAGVPDLSLEVSDFLFQATRELLFNVVKHAQADSVEVRVTHDDGRWVQVEVRDDGQGCGDTAVVERGRTDGGFGLFNIRQRLDFLGGDFAIAKVDGGGCSAKMRVPVTPPEEMRSGLAAAPATRPPRLRDAEPTGGLRVMLADDHKILRQGIAAILRDQGDLDIIGEASDGEAAVLMARELRPDVIVMDVSMPRMDGIEATRLIKSEQPEVRVVALSMHIREDMDHAMRKAGAAVYLTKGCPADELIAAVRGNGKAAIG